jgi:hypothetical protein
MNTPGKEGGTNEEYKEDGLSRMLRADVLAGKIRASGEYEEIDPLVIEKLISMIPDPRTGSRAIAALEMAGTRAVPQLTLALQNADSSIREWSAYILGNIGDERPLELLCHSVCDEECLVRWKAIRAIGKILDMSSSREEFADLCQRIESVRDAIWKKNDIGAIINFRKEEEHLDGKIQEKKRIIDRRFPVSKIRRIDGRDIKQKNRRPKLRSG